MCGVLAFFAQQRTLSRQEFIKANDRLKHRGPDASGVWTSDNGHIHLGHNRLSVVSINTGAQPIVSNNIILCVNGEIYNHRDLSELLQFDCTDISDCESIIHVYKRYGPSAESLRLLDGVFSFVLYDQDINLVWAARDPYGVTPFYYGNGPDGLMLSSELKSMIGLPAAPIKLNFVKEFPPGQLLKYEPNFSLDEATNDLQWTVYHTRSQSVEETSYEIACNQIKSKLWTSVLKRQQMTDVPSGVLLSGGLDSSIIAAIACIQQKALGTAVDDRNEKIVLADHRVQSFSVGLVGSPDHEAAQLAADAIGTCHHQIFFTIQEALDVIPQVIYHLETYDTTTIRASVPMYLLSRAIKARGIKMLLSGEASDELFGGYLYFHRAPSVSAFKEECERRVQELHYFDCLRANKSTMAWGLEVRVPFLDKTFVEEIMQLPTEYKMCGNGKMEKQLLRDAFKGILPDAILTRQKEQFSDGNA